MTDTEMEVGQAVISAREWVRSNVDAHENDERANRHMQEAIFLQLVALNKRLEQLVRIQQGHA